jgi:hypothetical protein
MAHPDKINGLQALVSRAFSLPGPFQQLASRKGPIAAPDATKQTPGRKLRSTLRFAGDYSGDSGLILLEELLRHEE